MFKKFFHFLQYNNLTVLILAFFLIAGSGAFAATETGQEIIGEQATAVQGEDNTLLAEAELDTLDMDFTVQRVQEDETYYYVTYTFLDLVKAGDAWEYQLQEKVRRVKKPLARDLGAYLAEELKEEYEGRIADLKEAQAKVMSAGEPTIRIEVTAYSGLIGATLDLAGRVFPGYEPVAVRTVPSPSVPPTVLLSRETAGDAPVVTPADNLTDVWEEYIIANDPDRDDIFGSIDNCPLIANTDQADADADGIGDACETPVDTASTTIPVEGDDTNSDGLPSPSGVPATPPQEGNNGGDVPVDPLPEGAGAFVEPPAAPVTEPTAEELGETAAPVEVVEVRP